MGCKAPNYPPGEGPQLITGKEMCVVVLAMIGMIAIVGVVMFGCIYAYQNFDNHVRTVVHSEMEKVLHIIPDTKNTEQSDARK